MKKASFFLLAAVLFIVACEKNDTNANSSSTGKGGSLAKFTIVGSYLYAVSSHHLYAVDVSNPSNPVSSGQTALNFDMETIYSYKNRLFIGSRTGLYIYSIDVPSEPRLIGEAKHARSCDPVVANDSVSYSTLKGNTNCGSATSGLYVHDVKNLNQPVLKKTITMKDPLGLGIADSALYVCYAEGLKVYSIKNAYNPVEIKTIPGVDFADVIPYDNILICWASGGVSLYDITDRLNPAFIKKIAD
jgi:hypothetical protein